jgi:hypothetical protein
MHKLIIAGGRDFKDEGLMIEKLNEYLDLYNIELEELEIVSGMARGADSLAVTIAEENEITLAEFPAKWDKHGKAAGYKRNTRMAKYADALLAFWDGESRGTRHMIDTAKEFGLTLQVVLYKKEAA